MEKNIAVGTTLETRLGFLMFWSDEFGLWYYFDRRGKIRYHTNTDGKEVYPPFRREGATFATRESNQH